MKRVLHKLVALSLTVAMALTMVISGFAAEPAAVTTIDLPGTLTVGVGESIDVYLDVAPFDATPGEITWTSGNTDTLTVEKVDDGSNTHVRITGVKATEEGSPVELTAQLSDGTEATCMSQSSRQIIRLTVCGSPRATSLSTSPAATSSGPPSPRRVLPMPPSPGRSPAKRDRALRWKTAS